MAMTRRIVNLTGILCFSPAELSTHCDLYDIQYECSQVISVVATVDIHACACMLCWLAAVNQVSHHNIFDTLILPCILWNLPIMKYWTSCLTELKLFSYLSICLMHTWRQWSIFTDTREFTEREGGRHMVQQHLLMWVMSCIAKLTVNFLIL